jgi:putative transcriptional regulator
LRSVHELLVEANIVPDGVQLPRTPSFDAIARVGGPVQTNTGWLVYRRDPTHVFAGEIDVGEQLAVTGDATLLAEVMRGGEPREFRMFLGYAGWGPGQLEAEVQAGAWLPAPVDADLVFDTEPDAVWDAAYRRFIGTVPGAFTSTKGGSA